MQNEKVTQVVDGHNNVQISGNNNTVNLIVDKKIDSKKIQTIESKCGVTVGRIITWHDYVYWGLAVILFLFAVFSHSENVFYILFASIGVFLFDLFMAPAVWPNHLESCMVQFFNRKLQIGKQSIDVEDIRRITVFTNRTMEIYTWEHPKPIVITFTNYHNALHIFDCIADVLKKLSMQTA